MVPNPRKDELFFMSRSHSSPWIFFKERLCWPPNKYFVQIGFACHVKTYIRRPSFRSKQLPFHLRFFSSISSPNISSVFQNKISPILTPLFVLAVDSNTKRLLTSSSFLHIILGVTRCATALNARR
jgi:hypothetical protein